MDKQPTYLRISILLAVFGLIGLLSWIGNPAFANIRTVNIIHLLAAGGCLGAAFMALGAHMHLRKTAAAKEGER